jgi:fumarate reductase subunit D
MRGARSHTAWWAFLVHRVSGVALALFLPAHFLVMGLALEGEARLGEFLRWSEQPLVVAGEWVLVMLLAAHLAGGLRLLALELLPWRRWQMTLAALGGAFAVASGLVFLLAR